MNVAQRIFSSNSPTIQFQYNLSINFSFTSKSTLQVTCTPSKVQNYDTRGTVCMIVLLLSVHIHVEVPHSTVSHPLLNIPNPIMSFNILGRMSLRDITGRDFFH